MLLRELAGRIAGAPPGQPVEHDVQRMGGLGIAAEAGAGERAQTGRPAAGDDLAVAHARALDGGGVEDLHRAGGELRDQTLVAVDAGEELLDRPPPLAGEVRQQLEEELVHHPGGSAVSAAEQPRQTERDAHRESPGAERVHRGQREQLQQLAPEERGEVLGERRPVVRRGHAHHRADGGRTALDVHPGGKD